MTDRLPPAPETLRAVQSVDPDASPDAVARYMAEIAEVEAALARVDVEHQPLPSGYSPRWTTREESGS
ncbi:MAG: hypothetical protein IT338_13215 [Thermomicrobiales bacterium]|nr:hypothetical protein [Thermomicrobiales bacterium]